MCRRKQVGWTFLPDPPWGGWWLGDTCRLCWGDPIKMLSWAGGTNEPLPSADGWWTGDVPLLFPPPIEWRPANLGEGMGDWGTCPMPSELLLLDRGSWIPVPGIELGPLLTVEAPLTEDAPLNWRRLFADDPRTTPDNVSISFLRGHGLWSFNGILHLMFLI